MDSFIYNDWETKSTLNIVFYGNFIIGEQCACGERQLQTKNKINKHPMINQKGNII